MANGNIIDGLHLIVDGNVSDPKVFEEANLQLMFERMVEALDMQLIWGPAFKSVEIDPAKLTGDVFQDEGGISGFCMISTSHMSIHVWPLRKTFMMDVFSCKMFSHEHAMAVVQKYLNPTGQTVRAVVRRPDIVV